jgi:hypothetical protein
VEAIQVEGLGAAVALLQQPVDEMIVDREHDAAGVAAQGRSGVQMKSWKGCSLAVRIRTVSPERTSVRRKARGCALSSQITWLPDNSFPTN